MPDIKGIGGVFIYSADADRLAAWYKEMFGLDMVAEDDGSYYVVFFTRDVETEQVRHNPVFAIRPADDDHPPLNGGLMLNLRVADFERTLSHLRAKGVTVADRTIEWERGKHGWIHDCDGNHIEIYEELFPPGSVTK